MIKTVNKLFSMPVLMVLFAGCKGDVGRVLGQDS